MKKIITSLSILLLFTATIFAQNSSPYWSIAGNNNATGTSKLGTTNKISLHFYTNDLQRLYIDSSNGRAGIGSVAPQARLHINSASGENPLRADVNGTTRFLVYNNGGLSVGAGSTPPSTGLYVFGNTGLGTTSPAYKLDVTGDINMTGGLKVGGTTVLRFAGNNCIGVGNSAGTNGLYNTAIGSKTLAVNSGTGNVAIGFYALNANTTGYSNVAAGIKALYLNKTASNVVAIGDSALYNNSAGFNVAVGSKALYANTAGTYNTALGYNADVANNSIINATAIGAQAVATQSNQVMLGGPSNISVRMQNASSYPKYLEFVTTGANIDWRFEHSSSGRYLYLSYSSDDFGSFSDRAVFDTISQANGYCLYLYGKAQSYSWDVFSDARLKKNINDLSNATDIISRLKPKTFFFNKEKYPSLNLPSIKQYGLIAQELEQVLPELVTTSTVPVRTGNKGQREMEELKSVSYTSLIPVLIKGMQEQQSRIDAQEQQLEKQQQENNELIARVEKLEALVHTSNAISGSSSSYLEQNIPNPTKGSTIIPFQIAKGSSSAAIQIIQSGSGKIIKTIEVNVNAKQTTLNTGLFAAGNYVYSLIVDGKPTDTRQMLLIK